jgi:hypothetical protein
MRPPGGKRGDGLGVGQVARRGWRGKTMPALALLAVKRDREGHLNGALELASRKAGVAARQRRLGRLRVTVPCLARHRRVCL